MKGVYKLHKSMSYL